MKTEFLTQHSSTNSITKTTQSPDFLSILLYFFRIVVTINPIPTNLILATNKANVNSVKFSNREVHFLSFFSIILPNFFT
jgi:hypothetical protein